METESSELTRLMLSAAREEAPSDRALERTLVALGAGAAVVGAGIAAGSATTAAGGGTALALKAGGGTGLFGLGMKWLGIGAVSGLVTMGAAVGVEKTLDSRTNARLPSVTATVANVAKESAPKAAHAAPLAPAAEAPA